MKVNIVTHTNGHGIWSDAVRTVNINKIRIAYLNEEKDFGELRAYFTKKSWNTKTDSIIYTDRTWLREFRKELISIGFSEKAAKNVDYSEAGMQGDDYVSLDVTTPFLKEAFTILDPKSLSFDPKSFFPKAKDPSGHLVRCPHCNKLLK